MKAVAVLTDLGLISEPDAAAMLGIGYTTLRRMRLPAMVHRSSF
jgi:hypothetical protein